MENILSAIRANIQTVLVGEERAASLLLTALIAGGHVLIEDVPAWARRCWPAPWPKRGRRLWAGAVHSGPAALGCDRFELF